MNSKIEKILSNGKRNIIWGAGREGVRVLGETIKQNVYIDLFCDADVQKQEISVWNKKVVSPDFLINNKEQYNVIIGVKKTEFVNEILDVLKINGITDIVLGTDLSDSGIGFPILVAKIWRFVKTSKEKKYVIFGCNQEAERIIHIADMLDISISFVAENNPKCDVFCGIEVRDVFDIGYEVFDEFMVLVAGDENDLSNVDILHEIGLKEKKHFDFWEQFTTWNYATYALDPNMGYTYINPQFKECPGITLFGSLKAQKRIVVLGGSTSDATRFPFKSWAELLYGKLRGRNDICILCAGCSGYNSSQELIKLVRDIIPYHPDIVISYSGVNDRVRHAWDNELKKYPFINPYQYDMTILEAQKIHYRRISENKEAYSFGLLQESAQYDRFKMNMHMMKAICESYGCIFLGILQPCIASIKNYTLDALELIINTQLEEAIKWSFPFYTFAINGAGEEYVDFTKIFEGIKDIWIDDCHVTEKGNLIIAEKVYELMKERKCIF